MALGYTSGGGSFGLNGTGPKFDSQPGQSGNTPRDDVSGLGFTYDHLNTEKDDMIPEGYYEDPQFLEIAESEKSTGAELETYLEEKEIYSDDSDEFEAEVKRRLDVENAVIKRKKTDLEEDEPADEDFHVDSDKVLESYYNYSVQTIGLLYYPFFLIVIWLFYTETVISTMWGIRYKDFLYYFLFSVIIIPFQIVVDILCFNIMAYYEDTDYNPALKKWDGEFRDRKNYWAGKDDLNFNLESKLRLLAKLAFSSQYYFVATFGMSGILFTLLGIMTILLSEYNPWHDTLVFLPVIWNWILLETIEKLTIKAREKLRIWETSGAKKTEPKKTAKSSETMLKFNEQACINEELIFQKFDQVSVIRNHEEKIKKNLNTMEDSVFASEGYNEKFLGRNKVWLKDNVGTLLSPKTTFIYKETILDNFQNIYGVLTLDPEEEEEQLDSVATTKWVLDVKEKEQIR